MATATINQSAVTSQPVPQQPDVDALDAAMNPTPQSLERHYFGEVIVVDAWFCVLQSGKGKVQFDPQQHTPDQKRTAIKLSIEVPGRDAPYTVDQDVVDFSKEWVKHTLPSLRALGETLRTLRGKHVHIKRVPTGETYTNKGGEVKDRTAIVFVDVFADKAARDAAADAFYKRTGSGDAANGTSDQPNAAVTQAPTANDAERRFAEQSLQTLWTIAKKDKDAFLSLIQQNAMIAKYFGPDSPEVQDIMQPLPF